MILQEVQDRIARKIRAWAKSQNIPEPQDIPFAPPPAHVAADLSCAWPLQAAKLLRRKPLEVARELAQALGEASGDPLATAPPEVLPPGFLNFRLTSDSLGRNLAAVLSNPDAYGAAPLLTKRRKILIEFVSANPTGPLHLASGRAATLGDSLARILRRVGHEVAKEYYVNDAGGRVELLGLSIRARYEQLHGKDSPVPEKGYHGEYLQELAAQAPSEASNWDAGAFGRYAMDRLLASHKADMEAFGVSFDRWFLESELYGQKAVESTLARLRERGMAYEKDGALWLGTRGIEEAADDKDRVLVKSSGQPTYFLADIAYHKDKFDRGWEELVDIWGADHHGYVPRMRAAIAALGKPPESFHAIIHQLVHLTRGKEVVKMSKRAGEFVSLRELLEEAGRDACRFFFAQRTPNAHMTFDLELARKQSQENPVYYVQYVHARICSIFREAAKAKLAPIRAEEMKSQPVLLSEPSERALLVKLAWFPDILQMCAKEMSPHPLPNYLLELAGFFHPFYEKCRVVEPGQKNISQARLALCGGARAVIAQGLDLLGVSAPESM